MGYVSRRGSWLAERSFLALPAIVWVIAVLSLLSPGTLRAEEESASDGAPSDELAETRATMRRVFGALESLLPGVLEGSFEETEAAGDEVRAALDQLAAAATDLEAHAPASNAAFSFLSQSLASDARAVRSRVGDGRYRDAGYRIVRMTQTCVACHARLPSEEKAAFAAPLIERLDVERIEPAQLARFDVATRQFDRALTRYESMLADPEQLPAQLEYSGAIADYLVVALRVRAATGRAEAALSRFAKRSDLTAQQVRVVPIWVAALERYGDSLASEPSLERAREILRAGAEQSRHPNDSSDLAHRVLASALLYRFLDAQEASQSDRATALLLLGETDAFLRRSFERSEAEFYLEQAIRLAPGTPVAQEAYARLEDQVLFGYTGSSGLNLPPDIERELEELRALAFPDRSSSVEREPRSLETRGDG